MRGSKMTRTAPERELDMFELQDLLDQLLTGGNETTTNAIGSGLMLAAATTRTDGSNAVRPNAHSQFY